MMCKSGNRTDSSRERHGESFQTFLTSTFDLCRNMAQKHTWLAAFSTYASLQRQQPAAVFTIQVTKSGDSTHDWLHSALVPACNGNSQQLCSQFKWLSRVTATHERALNAAWVFSTVFSADNLPPTPKWQNHCCRRFFCGGFPGLQ